MAVTFVDEQLHKRRSRIQDGQKHHTRVFVVRCSSVDDGTAVALTGDDGTNAVPGIGEAHPADEDALAISVDAEPADDSEKDFYVTVEYSDSPDETKGISLVSPVEDPAVVDWGYEEFDEAYFTDHSETPLPVVNTAGEPFDPFPTRSAGVRVVTIEKNEASLNLSQMESLTKTVNSNTITIDGETIAAGKAFMAGITAVKQSRGGNAFYRKRYTIRLKTDDWDDRILNAGYQQLVDGERKDIVDAEGNPVTKPWPLDEDGTAKSSPTDYDELVFKPYPSASWGVDFS